MFIHEEHGVFVSAAVRGFEWTSYVGVDETSRMRCSLLRRSVRQVSCIGRGAMLACELSRRGDVDRNVLAPFSQASQMSERHVKASMEERSE